MPTRRQHTKLSGAAYQALVRTEKALEPSPWALEQVRYASVDGVRLLELHFRDGGFSFGIPLDAVHELSKAKVKDLQAIRLSPARDTIIVDSLDAHISVEGLLRDVLATNSIFSRLASTLLGSSGGQKTSERKRLASAENGRKGGRPRLAKEEEASAT
jgi:hypothetical protein